MIARSPKATWTYVLVSDRSLPREEQTRFTLKHLTLAQESEILDSCARDPISGAVVRQAVGSEHLRALRRGLVGWENLRNAEGGEIAFEAGPGGGARDDLLFLLPLVVREELANALELELVFDQAELAKS